MNLPKDGIQALTGLIETDWAPYTFTMNWRFTRAGVPIHFHRGEPFCFFFPVPRDLVEAVEPEFRAVSEEPAFKAAYETWQENRRKFNIDLNDPQSAARREKWQKIYYVGDMPDGTPGIGDHRIKLRLKEFVEPKKR